MILTPARPRSQSRTLAAALPIAAFAALTGLGARMTVPLPFTPVPFTLQVLFVLLSGLALGARRGALSQLVYLAAITAGFPLDARALGPAVWMTPTAGYLLGFAAAAYAAGWTAGRLRTLPGSALLGGLAGIAALYAVGASWLTIFFLRGDALAGIQFGIAPFLMVDSTKAAIAAILVPASQAAIRRFSGG